MCESSIPDLGSLQIEQRHQQIKETASFCCTDRFILTIMHLDSNWHSPYKQDDVHKPPENGGRDDGDDGYQECGLAVPTAREN